VSPFPREGDERSRPGCSAPVGRPTFGRNSSEADIEEMGTIFGLAMAKLAEERAGAATPPGRPSRRHVTAAEWRRQRRRAS
jgi:hypothetical protein